jgi:hypothetical protein
MRVIEFLGMDEAEAPGVVWSGQANDERVCVLVKQAWPEYLVHWFTAHQWQRVDGTERQWMFEYDPDRSNQFGWYTDMEKAIEAAEAALTEHCGKEWS